MDQGAAEQAPFATALGEEGRTEAEAGQRHRQSGFEGGLQREHPAHHHQRAEDQQEVHHDAAQARAFGQPEQHFGFVGGDPAIGDEASEIESYARCSRPGQRRG